jgi:hypothetical protein
MSKIFTCPANYSESDDAFNSLKNICSKQSNPGIGEKQWEIFRRTGNVQDLNNFKNIFEDTSSYPIQTLKEEVKALACRVAACSTEYKFRTPHFSTNLIGATADLFRSSGVFLKIVYIISYVIIINLAVRYFLKQGTPANLIGVSLKTFTIFVLFLTGLVGFLFTSGLTWPGIYVMITCFCVAILGLFVCNVIFSLKQPRGWNMPGGFQLIFMILITLTTFILAVFYLTKIIKDKKVGEEPESVAPFADLGSKIHNYGYILLMVTIGLVLVVSILSVVKGSKYSDSISKTAGAKFNFAGDNSFIKYIVLLLVGLQYGINLVLSISLPVIPIVISLLERVIGSLITKASDKIDIVDNLVTNIGRDIYKGDGSGNSKVLKTIGLDFFGGGDDNGWAPMGTLLLNVVLGLMTNFNVVLSKDGTGRAGSIQMKNTNAF